MRPRKFMKSFTFHQTGGIVPTIGDEGQPVCEKSKTLVEVPQRGPPPGCSNGPLDRLYIGMISGEGVGLSWAFKTLGEVFRAP